MEVECPLQLSCRLWPSSLCSCWVRQELQPLLWLSSGRIWLAFRPSFAHAPLYGLSQPRGPFSIQLSVAREVCHTFFLILHFLLALTSLRSSSFAARILPRNMGPRRIGFRCACQGFFRFFGNWWRSFRHRTDFLSNFKVAKLANQALKYNGACPYLGCKKLRWLPFWHAGS